MVTEDILINSSVYIYQYRIIQFFHEDLILHFFYQQFKKFLSILDDIYFFDHH